MVNIPALGGSPVAFTDINGNQREIPLSQLYFDTHGINATNWPPYYSYKPTVDSWLAYLVAQGLLVPGTQPAGKPALVIAAREAGAAGNAVTVTFANPTPNADPKAATVDVTVTARQSWSLLTATSLETVLGTGPTTGTQPGLVFLTGQRRRPARFRSRAPSRRQAARPNSPFPSRAMAPPSRWRRCSTPTRTPPMLRC
jgi:hypothetical protein